MTSGYDFWFDFRFDFRLWLANDLRLWLPVWLPVMTSSKISYQFWFTLPVMTSGFTTGMISGYEFRYDFRFDFWYDFWFDSRFDFRSWHPVTFTINSGSPFQLWLPVSLPVWFLVMNSGYDFRFDFRLWLPAQRQAMARAQQTMLDMEQKGFFYIRISYKIKIICETQLSAEDRSFKTSFARKTKTFGNRPKWPMLIFWLRHP